MVVMLSATLLSGPQACDRTGNDSGIVSAFSKPTPPPQPPPPPPHPRGGFGGGGVVCWAGGGGVCGGWGGGGGGGGCGGGGLWGGRGGGGGGLVGVSRPGVAKGQWAGTESRGTIWIHAVFLSVGEEWLAPYHSRNN